MPPDDLLLDVKPALAQLRDANAHLSASVLSALSNIQRADLAAFAQTWIKLPVERRRRAAQMIVELAENDTHIDMSAIFRYLLNDEDASVRAAAMDGLWEDDDPALVKPLVGFLRSDPDARVRAAAADSLGRFVLLAEYDRLAPPLADLIQESLLATLHSPSESAQVRAPALESLGYSSRAGVDQELNAAYDSDEAQLRVSAIIAMGRSTEPRWRELVAGELDSPEARMRFEAVRALGELESRAYVDKIVALLDDPDPQMQMAAIGALGRIGGKPAKQVLTQIAASEDETLSAFAQDALQELEFYTEIDLSLFDSDEQEHEKEDPEE